MNRETEMGKRFKGEENNNEKYENRTQQSKSIAIWVGGIAQCLHS